MAKEEKFAKLVNQLHSNSWGKRHSAAEALGKLGNKRAVPDRITALDDSTAIVRSAAAKALGQLADIGAVPALVKSLADEENMVRVDAAWALGELGNSNTIEPLLKLLTDGDRLVCSVAATALVRLGYGHDENEVLTKAGMDLPEPELSPRDVRAIVMLALIPVGIVTGIMVLIIHLRHGSLHNMWLYGLAVMTVLIPIVLVANRIAPVEGRKDLTKLTITIIAGWVLASLLAFHFIVGWGPDAATIQVSVKVTESGFDAPDEIEAGLITFNFESLPSATGNLIVMRLKDSRTYDELKSVLHTGLAQLSSIVEFYGGTSALGLRNRQLVLDLREGLYVISSWSHNSGVFEISSLVLRPLRVMTRTSEDKMKAPTPSLTIYLNDSSMKVPGWWDSGNQTLRIINNGTNLHKFNIGELNKGKTMEDMQAWLESPRTSPPPYRRLFTTGVLSPGRGGWFTFNNFSFDPLLGEGNYIAYCDLPGSDARESHYVAEEFARFSIRSGYRSY